MKVPAIIAASVISFALGAGVCVGAMLVAFPEIYTQKPEGDGGTPDARSGPQMMMPQMGGPGGPGGGPGGPGGRPGGPGGGAPNAKVLLPVLIGKIDVLTQKPLSIQLDEEKQKKLAEQLQGLEAVEELSAEEAQNRLQAILEIVKENKETLEAAGYRWPGERPAGGGPGGGRPADVPNPFKEGDNNKHLKSLQEQLAKGKAG